MSGTRKFHSIVSLPWKWDPSQMRKECLQNFAKCEGTIAGNEAKQRVSLYPQFLTCTIYYQKGPYGQSVLRFKQKTKTQSSGPASPASSVISQDLELSPGHNRNSRLSIMLPFKKKTAKKAVKSRLDFLSAQMLTYHCAAAYIKLLWQWNQSSKSLKLEVTTFMRNSWHSVFAIRLARLIDPDAYLCGQWRKPQNQIIGCYKIGLSATGSLNASFFMLHALDLAVAWDTSWSTAGLKLPRGCTRCALMKWAMALEGWTRSNQAWWPASIFSFDLFSFVISSVSGLCSLVPR